MLKPKKLNLPDNHQEYIRQQKMFTQAIKKYSQLSFKPQLYKLDISICGFCTMYSCGYCPLNDFKHNNSENEFKKRCCAGFFEEYYNKVEQSSKQQSSKQAKLVLKYIINVYKKLRSKK